MQMECSGEWKEREQKEKIRVSSCSLPSENELDLMWRYHQHLVKHHWHHLS